MARGICSNWKQPIFYNYDCKITKNLLFQIITKLENIGYPVYAINCDLGGSNRGLWNSLNISEENTSFKNPVSDKSIHVFADTPHMIKLLRNHFLDHGYILNGKMITSKPIVDLLHNTVKLDLKIAHKLTEDLLTVKGAQRQKVKYATKLFSHTISRAVTRLGTLGHYKTEDNWRECSDFFKIINDWFDVFNCQIPHPDSRNRVKAYGLALAEQNEILEKMNSIMQNMRKIGGNAILPFQKGILVSIKSLKNLYSDLKEDFELTYLLTYQLNQDPLEGLFSVIRAIGGLHDHPSALQFKYRLRNYLIGRNDEIMSDSANIQRPINFANQPNNNSILNEPTNLTCSVVTGELLSPLNLTIDDRMEIEWDEESLNTKHLEELRWDVSNI
ncbi:hypothetical protein ABEB36_015353 [Hypothenemus hampei]|uniref:Transposable element P transposase n=1 Tax=Hypothenemus hampei TaxID=57062 RepID=A0ABD1DZY4_HYPHA